MLRIPPFWSQRRAGPHLTSHHLSLIAQSQDTERLCLKRHIEALEDKGRTANHVLWSPNVCKLKHTKYIWSASFILSVTISIPFPHAMDIYNLFCLWHWPNIKSQGHSVKTRFQERRTKSTQTNYSLVNDPSFWCLWEQWRMVGCDHKLVP